MWIKSNIGEQEVEFGANRETKYRFRGSPPVCDVTDMKHASRLLSSDMAGAYELYDGDGAAAQKAAPKMEKEAPKPAKPVPDFILAQEHEAYVDVVVRISAAQQTGILQGSHRLEVSEIEDPDNVVLAPPPPELLDRLDAAQSKEELAAIAREVGFEPDKRWNAEKIRLAIKEKIRLGVVEQPDEGEGPES